MEIATHIAGNIVFSSQPPKDASRIGEQAFSPSYLEGDLAEQKK